MVQKNYRSNIQMFELFIVFKFNIVLIVLSRPISRMPRRMEVKDLKSAQLARQRSLGKSFSRKMLKRSNKAALCGMRGQRKLKHC